MSMLPACENPLGFTQSWLTLLQKSSDQENKGWLVKLYISWLIEQQMISKTAVD